MKDHQISDGLADLARPHVSYVSETGSSLHDFAARALDVLAIFDALTDRLLVLARER